MRLKGEPIASPRPEMMFVFQQYTKSIFPWKTVLDNVRLGVKYHSGASRQEIEKHCLEQLDLVGLGAIRTTIRYQLSGGMQQRVAHRARAGAAAEDPADGRAVQRARRHDAGRSCRTCC